MSWFSSKPNKKHALTVTASDTYNSSSPQIVPVNSEQPVTITSKYADIELLVRIKGFLGSSRHEAISTKDSSYFNKRNGSNISVQISFTPKEDIDGDLLLFGNDFAYPIKDYLPYGTSTGLNLFKRYVDPSVDGDLYIDEPYLYGKALSSFNVITDKVGLLKDRDSDDYVLAENLENGETSSNKLLIPVESSDRQKFFQKADNLKSFKFLKGHTYSFDFFSGLVSLKESNFNIQLPGGFEVNLSSYLNDKFNSVRYVLKKGATSGKAGVEFGDPLLVLDFQIEPLTTEPVEDREKEKQETNTLEEEEEFNETVD